MDGRVRFRHLRTFIEATRQHSISRAAEILNITQPAVSKTIRELEDILGIKLFEKDGRGIKPTRQGDLFLAYAGASMAAIQQGIDALKGAYAGEQVRIGALPTVSARVMPQVVEQLLLERPESSLTVVTGENLVLLDQLRRGDLDLVVGRLAAPEQMTELQFEHLYSEQVRFVVRKGHPLLSSRQFDFSSMNQYTVVMPTKRSVIRPFVERFLLSHGQGAFPRSIESVSEAFGRAFVAETDAVWIISEGVVARDVTLGLLDVLPIDTDDTRGAVGLTRRRDAIPNPSVEMLGRILRESARNFQAGSWP